MISTIPPPPKEEIRVLCSTEQLAKVATAAAEAGLTIEEYVTRQLTARMDREDAREGGK